jgi:hypothetical protein
MPEDRNVPADTTPKREARNRERCRGGRGHWEKAKEGDVRAAELLLKYAAPAFAPSALPAPTAQYPCRRDRGYSGRASLV